MNLVIDFTDSAQYSVEELESFEDISEITFIVPVFIFLQNNFSHIFRYVEFLSRRPLIRTSVKPVVN